MEAQLRTLVERMHAAQKLDDAVDVLQEAGGVIGMPLPAVLEDVSGNTPVRDNQGQRLADRFGWPSWMTDNWYGHALARQHPIYLRCRFEGLPFANHYAELWAQLDPLTAAQQHMKRDTERFGLASAITVPVHLPLGRTAAVHWSSREPVDVHAILASFGHHLMTIGHLFTAIMQPIDAQKVGAGDLAHLTDRQIDCLYWLASGKTLRETAIILKISVHTVREHLRAITERLHAVNTPHAIALASQFGIIGRLR